MNVAASILELAALRIKDGTAWGVVPLAVDKRGTRCCPASTKAVKWCSIGAVLKEGHMPPASIYKCQHTTLALCSLDYAASLLFKATSIRVNDEMGHDAVMRMYRRAWLEISSTRHREAA